MLPTLSRTHSAEGKVNSTDSIKSPVDGDNKELGAGYAVHERAVEDNGSVDTFEELVAEEKDHDIKLRTMSWQRCALLLFGDQVCLAIMAQAWSYKVLGWVPSLITSFLAITIFWITSITMWKFIMKYPHVRDICDIGYILFGNRKTAYYATMVMLLLNNVMLCGFHVLTGSKILNTLSDHSLCTVSFSVIITIISIIFSLPRTLNHVSLMSIGSAICMAIAILLFMIFAGKEAHPATGYGGDWPTVGAVTTYAFPQAGTTWVDSLNAVLNIVFLAVPQILFPTFISEMKNPRDFPKSLAALAIASFPLFIIPAVVGFAYLGQYAEAPAFGSLQDNYKKISFAFVIVPTIVIGVIYANVSAKFIYRSVLGKSRHAHSNTWQGWSVWVGIMTVYWIVAFIFAEVIPSMGDFLSILAAAFDSQYGFLFWAIAYAHMYKGKFFSSPLNILLTLFHAAVFCVGLLFLGPGLYTSITAIIADYSGATRPAFTCKNLAL